MSSLKEKSKSLFFSLINPPYIETY